jgi:hypothetical protein
MSDCPSITLSLPVAPSITIVNPDVLGLAFSLVGGSNGGGGGISQSELEATGSAIGASLGSLSGWAASVAALQLTGQTVYSDLTGMSGAAAITYATTANLTSSGLALFNDILAASGLLTLRPKQLGFTTDGGGSVIGSGIKGYVISPYAGTITSWTLVAAQAGSMTIDLYKIAAGPIAPTTSIIGVGTYPSLASAQIAYSASPIANWTTTAVATGDIIAWVVSGAPTSITRFTFQLTIT